MKQVKLKKEIEWLTNTDIENGTIYCQRNLDYKHPTDKDLLLIAVV